MPLEKVTIRLEAGDTEALQSFFPTTGYNVVIRELVHKYVKQLREQQAGAVDRLPRIELEPEL